jgi:hypothetical protein
MGKHPILENKMPVWLMYFSDFIQDGRVQISMQYGLQITAYES